MIVKRISLLPLLLALCAGCHGPIPPHPNDQDRADISALEDAFAKAVRARDVNAIMACYISDPDIVVFDVGQQYTGSDAYRKDWQDFLAQFPGPVDYGISNLDVTPGGDIAYGHSIQHISLTGNEGKKMELTFRVTDGYKKNDGHWLIAHEHISVPVDLATFKPNLNAK